MFNPSLSLPGCFGLDKVLKLGVGLENFLDLLDFRVKLLICFLLWAEHGTQLRYIWPYLWSTTALMRGTWVVNRRFSCERASCMITRVIISNILNGLAGLKDLLRDVFNARTIDLLGRGLHIEIIFHDVHDRSASEVEHYSLVVVYLLGGLGNSESLSWSEGLGII